LYRSPFNAFEQKHRKNERFKKIDKNKRRKLFEKFLQDLKEKEKLMLPEQVRPFITNYFHHACS
jgi:hypothetical protein